MFAFGDGVELPPKQILITEPGASKRALYLQLSNASNPFTTTTGNFSGRANNAAFSWLLHDSCNTCETSPGKYWNHGFFHFTDTSAGHPLMQIADLRLYSMAGIKLYSPQHGLVEDVQESFLQSAYGTIPPTPVVISQVTTAAEMLHEVAAGHELVGVYTTSAATIFVDGLRFSDQFDSLSTFVGPMAGPTVRAWAGVARVETVAAESFVPGRSLMPTPLSISAPSGLRSVSVFNGAELFRRFVIPPGQSHFFDTLMLEASVHRTLTLVVEDRLGRVAITSARRAWKSGRRSVVFCTDQCVP